MSSSALFSSGCGSASILSISWMALKNGSLTNTLWINPSRVLQLASSSAPESIETFLFLSSWWWEFFTKYSWTAIHCLINSSFKYAGRVLTIALIWSLCDGWFWKLDDNVCTISRIFVSFSVFWPVESRTPTIRLSSLSIWSFEGGFCLTGISGMYIGNIAESSRARWQTIEIFSGLLLWRDRMIPSYMLARRGPNSASRLPSACQTLVWRSSENFKTRPVLVGLLISPVFIGSCAIRVNNYRK